MFKVIKYILLANLFKKAKKSFIMLFIYVVSLILISFIMNDLMSVAIGVMVYILLLVKWAIILSLLRLIGFSVLKIFNIATNPLKTNSKDDSEDNEVQVLQDVKKERILSKEKLFTQSDLILQKYMKD